MRFSQICNTRVNPIMIGNQGFSILLQFCRLFVHFLQILYLVKFFDKVFTIFGRSCLQSNLFAIHV